MCENTPKTKYIEKLVLSQKNIFSKECLIIINNVTDAKESRIICHLKGRQRHVKIQIMDKVCVSRLSLLFYIGFILMGILLCMNNNRH